MTKIAQAKYELAEIAAKKQEAIKDLEAQTYLSNLYLFNTQVLGVEESSEDKESGIKELATIHKQLCNFVQYSRKQYLLIEMPRGHLKSTLVTVGYSLQRILKDVNTRILIANATAPMAQAFLGQIKNHLERNKTIHKYWEDLSQKTDKWRDDLVTFRNSKAYKAKEANLIAYGLGGSLVSQHYDVIILDDPHNRENTGTKDRIDKVKLQYKDLLDLLEPGGKFIVIGTRWHDDDLYGDLEDPEGPNSGQFEIFKARAIEDGVIEKQEGGSYQITQGNILWPEKYSKDILNNLLEQKGIYEFSCQYQNQPVDRENAVFKRSWFKYYEKTDLRNRLMNTFTAIDPAISLKERADYTVIITIGVDIFKNIYVLEIKRDRYTEYQMVEEVMDTYRTYKPKDIVMETVAFQKTLQNYLVDISKKRKSYLPIREIMPEGGESKEKRIRSLQPYYMRGSIFHESNLKNIDYLEDELLRFPRGKHDDTVDALAYAVSCAREPRQNSADEDGRKKSSYLY